MLTPIHSFSLCISVLAASTITTASVATTYPLIHTFNDSEPAEYDGLGMDVAIDGNHVLVSFPGDDTFGSCVGRVHLYNAVSGQLIRTFDDPTPSHGDNFGMSVSLDGDRVLIGAFGDESHGSSHGQAHLFDIGGNLIHTLDDPTPSAYKDWFGFASAIDGDYIVIGAPSDDTAGSGFGQAHIFSAIDGSLLHTIEVPTSPYTRHFGWSVDIQGDHILVGAPGSGGTGYAYLYNTDGELLHTFKDPNRVYIPGYGNDEFGCSVSIDGNHVLIGAQRDSSLGREVGQAYLFDLDGTFIPHFRRSQPVD